MSEERFVESVDPADAFSALSDDTRVDILHALWETEDHAATFSSLRETVGMADSGQFNYHLSQLMDHFVSQDDEGYRLTVAGRHVVGGLLAGTYTLEGSLGPVPLDEPCPFCGGDRYFRYRDERISMRCEECGGGMQFDAPPGLFAGYDSAEAPAVAERYIRVRLAEARSGICPFCAGRMAPSIVPDIGDLDIWPDLPDDVAGTPVVRFECDRCREDLTADMASGVLDHPAVVSFYDDHGVDVRETPLARFVSIQGRTARLVQEDPLRVAVAFEVDDERLELVVDESFTVRETERTRLDGT